MKEINLLHTIDIVFQTYKGLYIRQGEWSIADKYFLLKRVHQNDQNRHYINNRYNGE